MGVNELENYLKLKKRSQDGTRYVRNLFDTRLSFIITFISFLINFSPYTVCCCDFAAAAFRSFLSFSI